MQKSDNCTIGQQQQNIWTELLRKLTLTCFALLQLNIICFQATLKLGSSGRQVFYPCSLCSNETFRWQFDLYKHYATQHYYDQLLSQLNLAEGQEPPYQCPQCNVSTDTERQLLLHYALTHRAVQKLLEKDDNTPAALTHR